MEEKRDSLSLCCMNVLIYKASSTTKEKNKQYTIQNTHIQKEQQQQQRARRHRERERRHSGAGYLFDLIIIIYRVVGWFVG